MMTTSTEKRFFGHPRQLGTLFFIEMWERFAYYGMQSILVVYMYTKVTEGGLGMDEGLASGIVGAYAGSIYLTTIVGGWLADRVLGTKNTLLLSTVVMMVGTILVTLLPGYSSLVGLPFISLGSGSFKATASAMVGSLYEAESEQKLRDAGFSIFYTSINTGVFIGTLLAGYLQPKYGFRMVFASAVVGMVLCLLTFLQGKSKLPETPVPNPLPKEAHGKAIGIVVGILAVIGGLIATGLLNLDNLSKVQLGVVAVISLGYFFAMFNDRDSTEADRRHLIAYIPLFVGMCLFWAAYLQMYTVVTAYFDKTVPRHVGGFEVPVSYLLAFQSTAVIVLASTMAALWTKMGDRQPSSQMKFALAALVIGGAYAIFIPYLSTQTPMPLVVLMVALVLITVAELLLSPISLSFATKVAPQAYKTQMVSFNFLTLSLGFTLGGVLGDTLYTAETASRFYIILTALGIGAGVALLLMMPFLNRLLHDVE